MSILENGIFRAISCLHLQYHNIFLKMEKLYAIYQFFDFHEFTDSLTGKKHYC